MKRKNSIMGMAFFGPALVLLTLFLFLPMLLTLGFSFTDYFALNPELTHFVGLENYTEYASGAYRDRYAAVYPQRRTGSSVHCHYECMAGRRLSDDHFPGRTAEHQPGPL